MQKLASALSTEISRLARIEATKALAPLKAEIAQLKKLVRQQGKSTKASSKRSRTGKTRGSTTNGRTASSARYTPESIRAHRELESEIQARLRHGAGSRARFGAQGQCRGQPRSRVEGQSG